MVLRVNEMPAVVERIRAGQPRYQWPPFLMDAASDAAAKARGASVRAWAAWVGHFARSPHGATEELVGLDAYIDRVGNAVIAATCTVTATGELVFRSPYCNPLPFERHDGQTACRSCAGAAWYDCPTCFGRGYEGRLTEGDEIADNPHEWLDTMATATDWEDGPWDVLSTGPRAACLGTPDGYIWLHSWRVSPEFRLVPTGRAKWPQHWDYAPDRQRYPQPADEPACAPFIPQADS